MKRSNTEHVGDIINQFLRQEGLETPLNQYRLIERWRDVVGDSVANYTGEIYIRNQTLIVKIKSSALRNELMMMRSDLVKKLNNSVGAQVISEIMFR